MPESKSANRQLTVFLSLEISGLLISAISPHDYFTWILEVFPAIIATTIIFFTRNTFPLSSLAYLLILFHSYILFVGGHYTYAEVPLFEYIRDLMHSNRNNYDKLGHFAQGFIPAIVAREILLRKDIVSKKGWLAFICVCICLAVSALYEMLEAAVAMLTGDSADSFLGTQGYVWDTQTDMFYALLGALASLLLLSGTHNKSLAKLKNLQQTTSA